MPTIVPVIDGDKAGWELLRLPGVNPELKAFANETMDKDLAAKIKLAGSGLFLEAFKISQGVLAPELGYDPGEFTSEPHYVGPDDKKPSRFIVHIWATNTVAWYDSEEDMYSHDLKAHRRKLLRICKAISSGVSAFIEKRYKTEWEVAVWPHLTDGMYFEP